MVRVLATLMIDLYTQVVLLEERKVIRVVILLGALRCLNGIPVVSVVMLTLPVLSPVVITGARTLLGYIMPICMLRGVQL